MIRILFIASALNRAGTETFMMNVFRYLPRDTYQVDFLIFTQEQTDYTKEVEAAGSHVWRLVSRKENPWAYICQLSAFFRAHASEYHAIHWCGNSLSSMMPIYWAWRYRIPVRIVHAHNSSAAGLHNRLLHRFFRRFVACISTHHLACSSAAAKWFFGADPHAMIIRNGVDVNRYSYNAQTRKSVREHLGISPTTLVLGHIGRFCPEKNHTFLLDIFAQVLALQPDALLLLAGKGELEPAVQAKAKQLGIASNVRFLGERTDIADLLQSMDAFVLPSTFEGQPFVLIEAQAAGLPCFVSDVVNRDIAITPNVSFLSLDQEPSVWAQHITAYCRTYQRTDTTDLMEQAGYSVRKSMQQLTAIYQA